MPTALRILTALFAAASLAGCATTQRLDAARDVHGLLISIRDNDHAAFDAHVDRAALQASIQARLVNRTRSANVGEGWKGLGLWLSGPLSRAAGGLLIQPEVFRAVADYYGYRPSTPVPGVLALASALTSLPDGRVCATTRKGGTCLLTFADEAGLWRLVDFDVDGALRGSGARPR
jgi:hypothetical protein